MLKSKVSPEEIMSGLFHHKAISVPFLDNADREMLLREVEQLQFKPQDEVVGPHKVRQQLSVAHVSRQNVPFFRLAESLREFLDETFEELETAPFTSPLTFNSVELIRYEKGSNGISPHRDFASDINLICLCTLVGKADFFTCDDREGTNPVQHNTSPGNVIFMTAPGFLGSKEGPFHFVSEVREDRIVCAIRQSTRLS